MEINNLQSKARCGDDSAEDRLFRLLRARFLLLAQRKLRDRDDSEEVVQEALKTVFEKHREMEFETSFAAWAHRVLENKILTFLRTRKRHNDRRENFVEGTAVGVQDQPDSALESRLLDCLRKLNRVNRRHARILVYKYQGFTVAEICDRLGLTRTNLYTLLSRARSMLEFCLEKGDLK